MRERGGEAWHGPRGSPGPAASACPILQTRRPGPFTDCCGSPSSPECVAGSLCWVVGEQQALQRLVSISLYEGVCA